jgi:hypothetical protein
MKKNYLFLLFAVACLTGKGYAQSQAKQPCGSTEARQQLLLTHPEILKAEEDFNAQVKAGLKNIDLSKMAAHRTTADASELDSATFWYDIPIVIHIIHDYNNNADYIPDNTIYNDLVNLWNPVYAAKEVNPSDGPDSTYVLNHTPNFYPYIGNPHIRLHLAAIDPNGKPTKGITRHRSYLTYSGGEQAKFDDWDPTSYVNIWTVNTMSTANGMAAAYAHFATDVAGIPFYDGVIALWDYIGTPHTINHEMGHMMNLYHPWGNTNNPDVACGDDDVDDTPPTKGHAEPGCALALSTTNTASNNSMWDTACAENYFKIYTDRHGNDSLVNYPDTTNTLNIMDYTYCAKMFTKGQVTRMHTTLNSDVAGRNNLWSGANLVRTGIKINATDTTFAPIPDLPPTVEYSVLNAHGNAIQYFTCAKLGSLPTGLTFKDESWNDTIVSRKWTFGNGAAISTSTVNIVSTSFSTPGWANVTLADSGNHTATTTNSSTPIFVAQATGVPGAGYYEEFKGATATQWPTFNYYNNEFKWQHAGVGFYDDSSMMYTGYDNRVNPSFGIYPNTGEPIGDFDDMFSIPVDLSGFSGACSLNYMYSGASRSANSLDINDALEIDYSTDRSNTWTTLTTLTKAQICNKGEYAFAYAPVSQADWAPMSINIPAAARTNYTIFRFRYKPGIAVGYDGTTVTGSYSSGNNFYMDRVNFSPWPASVSNVVAGTADVVVAPNPTNGDAYVIIKDMDNVATRIVVTDITGKVVYTTNELISGNEARVQIPHAAISVQGMYIVQTITGTQVTTKKLVVE